MERFTSRSTRNAPYYVMWNELIGETIYLRRKHFKDPKKRDRFALKLKKREGFIRYVC